MSEPRSGPFELDDAPEPHPASTPLHAEPRTPTPASPPMRPPGPPGEVEVSDQTVAERQGRAVERIAGVRPLPEGWPLEALGYPWRGAGAVRWLIATAVIFGLDLVGWSPSLRFLGWILKVPALLFVVRWQLDLAGMSAAGHDAPGSAQPTLALDRQGIGTFVRLLRWAAFLVAPSAILWLIGPRWIGIAKGTDAPMFALLVLASAWLAVIALATAVEAPHLKRPWVTLLWIVRRPVHLLAASAGWWGLAATEVWMPAIAGDGQGPAVMLGALLRAASVALVMVSARVLGVLGRRVDPERNGPA
jgi:hypothetical protein